MCFVGESTEGLERLQALVGRFVEVADEKGTVDVAFERFYERVGRGVWNQFDVEIESCCPEQTLDGVDGGIRPASLDSSDYGLDSTSAGGELSLAK